MKSTEYKSKLQQAIKDCIELRWEPRKKDPEANVPLCQLCDLKYDTGRNCVTPPDFWGDKCEYLCPCAATDDCCNGFAEWRSNETPESAQVIIDYLKNIDVDAWVKILIGRGVIEE